jgi:hypothetical protein
MTRINYSAIKELTRLMVRTGFSESSGIMFSSNVTFIIALKSYDVIINIDDLCTRRLGPNDDIIFGRALFPMSVSLKKF